MQHVLERHLRHRISTTAAAATFAVGLLLPPLLSVSAETLGELRLFCGFVVIAALLLLRFIKPPAIRNLWLVSIFICLGFSVQSTLLLRVVAQQLPEALQGQDLDVLLEIDSLPEKSKRNGQAVSSRFYARVHEHRDCAAICDSLIGQRLRLSWYHYRETPRLQPGQLWRLSVRLKRPRGTANPQGFDYQAWLLARGVTASGYVRTQQPASLVREPQAFGFQQLRYRLAKRLFDGHDHDHSALLRALLIGDKSHISAEQWQVLRATGTVHLMAISGLHIGLMATIGFLLGGFLARIAALVRPRGLFFIAPLCSITFAAVYAGMAGFEIPTQRALVMVCCANLAVWQGRRLGYAYIFIAALIVVLLLDPFAPLSAGFWLSFGAVAILLLGLGQRNTRPGRVKPLLKAQALLLLGMMVPLSLLGLPVALQSPLANLIAVPVVALCIVPLLFVSAALAIVSSVAPQLVLSLATTIVDYLWYLLVFLGDFAALWQVPLGAHSALLAAGCGGLAMLLLLLPGGARLRLLAFSLLLAFAFPTAPPAVPLRMTVLDVQQGLSVLIETDDFSLLYDTGAKFSDDFDMGSRVVLPYLESLAKPRLDMLLVSHSDNDHAGGARSILAGIEVSRLLAGEPQRLQPPAGAPAPETCARGERWRVGDTRFEVLWPPRDYTAEKSNNASCVLAISSPEFSVLLLGDIEKRVERMLLQEGNLPRHLDILIAPHHGSRSSSSPALLAWLQPRHVVFSAGFSNRYHHPNDAVVARYERLGTDIHRTDYHGAVQFLYEDSGSLAVTRWRHAYPKPWYW